MKQIAHYPPHIQESVETLVSNKTLGDYLKSKYPKVHTINNDKALYQYVLQFKNDYFKKYTLSKIIFDSKMDVINNALGMHTFISRVQGNKLKAKNEIRISSLFKKSPEAFLKMLVVHELSHLKQKEHNKAFYNLCTHIQPHYHQVELDLRLYLIHLDKFGTLY